MNFLTLTNYRSGSSFFQRLLTSHPDIGASQEMLSGVFSRKESVPGAIKYFYTSLPRPKAIGFKLMYSHIRPGVWEALMAIRPKPKVIQVVREDLLETVMWLPKSYDGPTEGGMGPPLIVKGKITMRIDTVIERMVGLRKDIDKHRDKADLIVTYSQFTGDKAVDYFYDNEMRAKVLGLLEVEDKGLKTDRNKKNTRPPNEEIITNWSELLKEVEKSKVERYYNV